MVGKRAQRSRRARAALPQTGKVMQASITPFTDHGDAPKALIDARAGVPHVMNIIKHVSQPRR